MKRNFRKLGRARAYARRHRGSRVVKYNKSVRTKSGRYKKGKVTGYSVI